MKNLFIAKGRGFKGNLIFYLKQNGRIQTEVTFVHVKKDGN